jgi:hypothetical protein
VDVDYRRFFALSEAFVRGALRVHPLGDVAYLELTRGEIAPTEPVRFHHDQGTRPMDYVGTTLGGPPLVSERLVALLGEHGFTGWRTFGVEIYDEHGVRVPGYHGLSATGRSGPFDDSLSPVMTVAPPVPTGEALPHRIGKRFWPETWDGSDVFSPEGAMWVVVTQAVRDVVVAAKLKNISLERLTEIEMLALDE